MTLPTLLVCAQGTIKGTVTDIADHSPLVSATIVVKGTTVGTISNYNGEYTLPLKAGDYTLQFLYLGYETVEESISVEDKQIVVVDKALTAVAIMGEEVVVTMQARGQLSAVNQQLRSNQIVNVVSAERIRELPDENAAQAISRLPGIHLDGSKVVIRGIESKMNKILINGIEMPSTEENNRATDLSIISANMLSGIEVYKTLTPDMDADAVGGVVNLRFREAQPAPEYSISLQGTYNQLNQMFGGIKIWGNASKRFFNNRLGAVLNLNYETRNGGDDRISVSYSEHDAGAIGEANYMLSGLNVYDEIKTSRNMGGSFVMDYDFSDGQIVYTSMLSHSTPEGTVYRDAMNMGANYHYAILDRSRHTSLLLSNSLHLEKQLGMVHLDAGLSHTSISKEYEFRYQTRFKDAIILPFYGDSITENKKLRMEPWEIYGALNPDADLTARYHDTKSIPTNYDESQWMADLNLETPLRISDNINLTLKAGGKFLRKNRDYDEELWIDGYPHVLEANTQEMLDWLMENELVQGSANTTLFFSRFRDNQYAHGKNFMGGTEMYYLGWILDAAIMDEFWLGHVDQNPETTNLLTDARAGRYDYWGWERLAAAYLMAEINLGRRLVIIPGVRFEQLHNEYSAFKVAQNTQWIWNIEDTLTKPADHKNILPHLHVRFRATNWWDIRFSYNHTLSRPDYNHAIPSIYYHLISADASAGNPYIRPARSENLDANFTFYSRKVGLFTVGGYLKRIDDIFYLQPTLLRNVPDTGIIAEFPTEAIPSLLSNASDFYVNSPYTAYVKGLELEWQSNFTWLPVPFNGVVLNANYTHVWSETKYMQHRIRYERPPDSFVPVAVEADTFYVNRLLHQADDIANVSIGYDLKGFSARLSFRFQGNVISSIGTRPEENEYTNDIYSYDIVIKQNVPLKFCDLEVYANAINFTNVPNRRYRIYPNKGETTSYERYSGRKFQLGIRLNF
jgi:TonB-dependent receptor